MEADTTAQVLTRPTDMVTITDKDNGEQRAHIYSHTNQGEWEPGVRNETRQSEVSGNESSGSETTPGTQCGSVRVRTVKLPGQRRVQDIHRRNPAPLPWAVPLSVDEVLEKPVPDASNPGLHGLSMPDLPRCPEEEAGRHWVHPQRGDQAPLA
jgi:hypothetical protein